MESGVVRGETLFHSFADFKIGEGQQLYFSPDVSMTNILTRVTGETGSEILRTLGVLGNADIFLMDPNGSSFGILYEILVMEMLEI